MVRVFLFTIIAETIAYQWYATQQKSLLFFCIAYRWLRMAKRRTIPIRLDDDVLARLTAAAERLGTTRTGIMRFCIEPWLRHFEIKGKASLPIDWDELLA